MTSSASAPPAATLTVFRLAALFTALAVTMGSVVCATGSGAACATWPGCQPGQIAPGWELNPLIEFSHRVVAVLTGPLVLASAVMSQRLAGADRWVRFLPWVALAGAAAAGTFGRLVVLSGLPTWLGAVDLFSALTAMVVMTVATVRLAPRSSARWVPLRVGGLATTTVVTVIALHVIGIFAAGPGSYTRCMGWPLWQQIGTDLRPWLQSLRLGLAVLGAVLVLATAVVAGRSARLRRPGAVLATLFAAEMLLGLVIRTRDLSAGLAAAYSVLAVAVLWCLGLIAALAWRNPTNPGGGAPGASASEISLPGTGRPAGSAR